MHIPPNLPPSPPPNNFESQQQEASREATVAQNQLQALPINEGPSSLTCHDITFVESAFGSASAVSDIAFELWGAELQDSGWNAGQESNSMVVDPLFIDPTAVNRLARQRIFQERLLQWENERGLYIPGMRAIDIDTKELNLTFHLTEGNAPIILPNLFSCLTKLEKLNVSGNSIILDLDNHPSLKELNLSCFTTFPNWLRNCQSIEKLEIYTLHPFNIPDWIGELTNLKNIFINGPLRDLPRSIGQLTQLESLVLHNAEIQQLPDELVNCKALKELDLDFCSSLTKLPQGIFSLPIEILWLDFCTHLELLPDGINHCSTLQNISLTHLDSLKELPTGLDKLHNLVEFRFWSNNDVLLPAGVFSAPKLEWLECMREDILAIEATDFLFEGLLDHEKALVLQRSQRLLEMLAASDEDADYHDLLTQTDIFDESILTPKLIGVRSRFASLIWQRHLEIERSELENEMRSLSIMHSILNRRSDDPSRPLSEELSYLCTALRAAVMPDTDLKLRKLKKRIKEIPV